MYGIAMSTRQQFGRRIAVRSVQDLEYVIKESEMLTGRPGRALQLRCGQQRFTYQVTFDGGGLFDCRHTREIHDAGARS